MVILHDNVRSRTTAVKNLLHGWQWKILEFPPYSPDMSPCNLRSLRQSERTTARDPYNTRDEPIRAIGRSIRNINKDGRADGVRRLPNIWKKVIKKGGGTILKVHKSCTPVNEAMSEITNYCHYFYPTCVCEVLFKI